MNGIGQFSPIHMHTQMHAHTHTHERRFYNTTFPPSFLYVVVLTLAWGGLSTVTARTSDVSCKRELVIDETPLRTGWDEDDGDDWESPALQEDDWRPGEFSGWTTPAAGLHALPPCKSCKDPKSDLAMTPNIAQRSSSCVPPLAKWSLILPSSILAILSPFIHKPI